MYVCVYTVWQVCVCVCVMVGMQYLILWHNNFDLYSEMLSSLTTTTIFKGHREYKPGFWGGVPHISHTVTLFIGY